MFNPGWVDLQVNGHNGVDYSDPSLTADKFLKSAEELLATGTAVFLPTIITGPLDVTCRNASIILETVEKHGLSEAIPGFHFEGPFISPKPGAVGAHNPVCRPKRISTVCLMPQAAKPRSSLSARIPKALLKRSLICVKRKLPSASVIILRPMKMSAVPLMQVRSCSHISATAVPICSTVTTTPSMQDWLKSA